MWSETTIPGIPRLLVVDASCNLLGWESEFCHRISNVLKRKGMHLAGEQPLETGQPQDLATVLSDSALNCILLIGHGDRPGMPKGSQLGSYWNWLSAHDGINPKLLAIYACEGHDPDTSASILSASDSFAQFAIVPQSEIHPHAAGLYFMKFFTELNLHAAESITGKMVWFSRSKARELLRKRRLAGEFGARG